MLRLHDKPCARQKMRQRLLGAHHPMHGVCLYRPGRFIPQHDLHVRLPPVDNGGTGDGHGVDIEPTRLGTGRGKRKAERQAGGRQKNCSETGMRER
ncbi:hypothetical protein GLI01_31000 [Gluconacetobacter liquefaciens]|nr:hypothetical protein GLI01_31000 [Gluconacetobacter liquefaciens]